MITIPRHVADAIESYRKEGRDNEFILSVRRFTLDRCRTYRAEVLAMYANTAGFEALLEALVNGYEREKTPEEIAEEKRISTHKLVSKRYCDEKWDAACAHSRTWEKYHDGFANGIRFTLSTLGIAIKGVYEPKGENA